MSINAKIALCVPQRKMCLIKQIFSCLSKIQSEKKIKGTKDTHQTITEMHWVLYNSWPFVALKI